MIDLALVILSDIARENPNIDVLNNEKNSVVNSYHITKWFFHEILDLKHRLRTLERETYSLKNRVNEDEQSMDKRVEEVNTKTLEMDRTMHGLVEQSSSILKDNENIKKFIHFVDDQSIYREQDPNISLRDMTLDDGARK